MRVGIDWDNTFTTDVECWSKICVLLQEAGYEVIIVTLRRNPPKLPSGIQLEAICTNYKAKAKFCRDAGKPIDIWIDDMPHFVGHDYELSAAL